jgi:hypothetical protein
MKNKSETQEQIIPKVFEFYYKAATEPELSIKAENGKIIPGEFNIFYPIHDDEITPSEEEWKNFWDKMDEIGIWDWKREYPDPYAMVIDGFKWNLKIELGDKKIESSGYNVYPEVEINEHVQDEEDFDEGEFPEPFRTFMNALFNLLNLQENLISH